MLKCNSVLFKNQYNYKFRLLLTYIQAVYIVCIYIMYKEKWLNYVRNVLKNIVFDVNLRPPFLKIYNAHAFYISSMYHCLQPEYGLVGAETCGYVEF